MPKHLKFILAISFFVCAAQESFAEDDHRLSVSVGRNSYATVSPYGSYTVYRLWSGPSVGFEYALTNRLSVEGGTSAALHFWFGRSDELRYDVNLDEAKWIGMKARAWDYEISPYPARVYFTAGGMNVDWWSRFSSAYAGLGSDVDFTERFFGSLDLKATLNSARYAQMLLSIAYRL